MSALEFVKQYLTEGSDTPDKPTPSKEELLKMLNVPEVHDPKTGKPIVDNDVWHFPDPDKEGTFGEVQNVGLNEAKTKIARSKFDLHKTIKHAADGGYNVKLKFADNTSIDLDDVTCKRILRDKTAPEINKISKKNKKHIVRMVVFSSARR